MAPGPLIAGSPGKEELDVSSLPKKIAKNGVLSCSKIYALPFDHFGELSKNRLVFVGMDEATSPKWVASETLRMITSYLSDRLREQERGVIKGLAVELANLGLDVDVEDVIRLKFSAADLRLLKELIDFAEFAKNTILGSLKYLIDRHIPNNDVSFIEARVKSPRAILRKMVSRKMIYPSDVEDILGIRLVCISAGGASFVAEKVEPIFIKIFPGGKGNIARDLDDHAANIKESESSAGYRASHLYFTIVREETEPLTLGCEFQVRSAFQDAWARVSHNLQYKKVGRDASRRVIELKKLADLRDEADSVINSLAGYKR